MSSSIETHWGLWLHAVRPVAELAEFAAVAEVLGAAAILVADEGTDRDLFVTLTALAQRTRRVTLFGAVTNPHSRHPVATAAAFASLAELAPDRIVVGLGAGGSRVFGPMGIAPRRPFTALVECLDVVDRLLRGDVVDHAGEIAAHAASLAWSPGALPIAIAGRGPRVEQLAGERADWILLAGRALEQVAALVEHVRAMGSAARGRPAAIGWNPNLAWTPSMIDGLRSHFAYMLLDMPPAERDALRLDDEWTARLREVVNSRGPDAAAAMIPDEVIERYAVTGTRCAVVARLAELRLQIHPELVLLDADDYSVGFLEDAASLVKDAGVVGHVPGG